MPTKKSKSSLYLFLLLILALPVILWGIKSSVRNISPNAYTGIEATCTENQFFYNGKCQNVITVLGQPNYVETAPDTITDSSISHASGVVVFNNSNGNDRLYVVDTGNSRILGFASLTDTKPSIVIGQPDFNFGACNRNNILGVRAVPTDQSLCLIDYPDRTNVAEYWMRSHFSVDKSGNLYVADVYNNRVLKYNDPFTTDTKADKVWGQKDFRSNGSNRNSGPSANSLNLSQASPVSTVRGSVTVDRDGNLWVADTYNSRVVRYPKSCENSNVDCAADIVLGQSGFTTNTNTGCFSFHTLSNLCRPTIVKEDPETGDIYVVDEFRNSPTYKADFEHRILVYTKANLKNGVSAAKEIVTSNSNFSNWDDYGTIRAYIPQITGLEFNTYKVGEYVRGKFWINEHKLRRTVLVDANGVVIKTIGGTLNSRAQTKYSDLGPGGSIGIDKQNNLYIADEDGYTVSIVSIANLDFANANPVKKYLFNQSAVPNSVSSYKFSEHVGVIPFKNQLLVRDQNRYLVYNNYLQKKPGDKADLVVGQKSESVRLANSLRSRSFNTVDDLNVLWTRNTDSALLAYSMPLTSESKPIRSSIDLYWADTGEKILLKNGDDKGVYFDKVTKKLWLTDRQSHRVLRVSNYYDVKDSSKKLLVDMVLGQKDKSGTKCNMTQEENWLASGIPAANTICRPTQVITDKKGNLYVVDNDYECHGNNRIVMYESSDLATNKMFPDLSAKKVFVRSSMTELPVCDNGLLNQPASPVNIAFNSKNQMFVGNDGYYGSSLLRARRQIWVYLDPLLKNSNGMYVQGQKPDSFVSFPVGAVGEMQFDDNDNLIVQDHTWPRVVILKIDTTSVPTPIATLTPVSTLQPTVISTPVPTPISTSTPVPVSEEIKPVNGDTIGIPATIVWQKIPGETYSVLIGSQAGASTYGSFYQTSNSITLTRSNLKGKTIYVRIIKYRTGSTIFKDYFYKVAK